MNPDNPDPKMSIDQSSIDVIRNATFPASWAWRGYDKGEVQKFLDTLANWLAQADTSAQRAEDDTAETELSVQGDAIRTLESRIAELERELGNANRRERRLAAKLQQVAERRRAAVAAAAKRGERPRAAPKTAPKTARTRPPASRRRKRTTSSWAKVPRGKLDINAVTFEELRGLGVSITDSARVIALREIRGGYTSLEVLDQLEGLPAETVRELKARFVINVADKSD
jgi:DivIVA domain-containing protein